MFSRIKGALDRSLAEEQARHKASTERGANSNPASTTNNNNGLPLRQADPAVFEDAFKLDEDDTDAINRSATPKPAPPENGPKVNSDDTNPGKSISPQKLGQNSENEKAAEIDADAPEKTGEPALPPSVPPASTNLPPKIVTRLKRLDKLEGTYKELLRSYRIAHSRAVAIEPFERTLREITPLHSISDPDALVEYIGQLNLKSDMVLEELKRVSAEKNDLQKKSEEADKEIATLKNEKDALDEAARLNESKDRDATEKSSGGDQSSYDDSKNELILTLQSEVDALKVELAAAQEAKARRESINLPDDGRVQEATQLNSDSIGEKADSLDERNKAIAASYDAVLAVLSKQYGNQMPEEITRMVHEIEGHRKVLLSESSATQNRILHPQTKSAKKKNKKKKKSVNEAHTDAPETSALSPLESLSTEALTTEIHKLQDEILQSESRINDLSNKLNTAESALKRSEGLEEKLSDALNNKDESRVLINKLESEIAALQSRIPELEKELTFCKTNGESNAKQLVEYDSIKRECEESRLKLRTLESDLGASQKVAQDRWKEIVGYKDLLAKIQPELKTLRQVAATVKDTQELYASVQNEVRTFEKQEKDLKKEITTMSRKASERESEVKLINDRLAAEKTLRTKLEDEKRKLNSSNQRLEGEKNQISAEADKTVRKLENAQSELSSLRPKITKLEDELAKLQKEKNLAKEDVDLKTQQYNNAQNLLASMRDQTTELTTRLKEAQGQAENLEEELAEVQKHLAERTREAETMRRMLADVNERADGKVREMKSRMEAAIEERDRIEDESSTLGRRRSRENEELKDKVRELEREVKALSSEKDDLEEREREWNLRRQALEKVEEKAAAESEETGIVVTSLRSALDASEKQVRDAEKQKTDLRKLLDEARNRYDKVNKELKTFQTKLNTSSGSSVANGGRASNDSTRSGSNGTAAKVGNDMAYVKTIFLQFLEVKDDKVRSQLVPVLSKLLGFDKNDDIRCSQAIQRMSKSGK